MSCSFLFLELNGYDIDVTDDEIENVAKRIAEANMDFQQLLIWFEERIQPVPPISLTFHSVCNTSNTTFFNQ